MKWIAVAVAMLCIAIAFDLGLLVYAIYALFGILTIARLVTNRWSDNVVAKKTISVSRGNVGDVVHVSLTIENQDRYPITWMLVEDLVPPHAVGIKPALEIEGDQMSVVKFGPGEKHQLDYSMTCKRRGYFQIGPTLVETGDMFGFNRRFRIVAEPKFLMIYPKIISLGGYDI